MKLFDVFQFNNEIDILEIRLKYYYDVIDYFIITEANQTFFGENKPFYYLNYQERLNKYKKKIIYNQITNSYKIKKDSAQPAKYFTDYNKSYDYKHSGKKVKDLANQFKIEIYQKDLQILPLLNGFAKNEDIIILGDVDEFVNIEILKKIKNKEKIVPPNQHLNIEMYFFNYSVNFLSKKTWYGTRIFAFGLLDSQNKSLDLMRHDLTRIDHQKFEVIKNSGWHFSTFGSINLIKQKLQDLNFNGKKTAFILRIFYKMFTFILVLQIKRGIDVISRSKFYKVDPSKYLPADLLIMFKKHFAD